VSTGDHVKNSFVVRSSKLSVSETAAKLKSLLETKNIKLFAHIDHSAAAKENGMELSEEQVLIFGDPKVGTHLMQEEPAIGFELPLRMLIWSEDGTKVAYREPLSYLEEFNIIRNREIIEKMSILMDTLSKAIAEVD